MLPAPKPDTPLSPLRERFNASAERIFVAYLLPIPAAFLVLLPFFSILRFIFEALAISSSLATRLLQWASAIIFLAVYLLASRTLKRSALYKAPRRAVAQSSNDAP